jgi:hypothetical protein
MRGGQGAPHSYHYMKYILTLTFILLLNSILSFRVEARGWPDRDTTVHHFSIDAALLSLFARWERDHSNESYFPLTWKNGMNKTAGSGGSPNLWIKPWFMQKPIPRIISEFMRLFVASLDLGVMPWIAPWRTLRSGVRSGWWGGLLIDSWTDPRPETWHTAQPGLLATLPPRPNPGTGTPSRHTSDVDLCLASRSDFYPASRSGSGPASRSVPGPVLRSVTNPASSPALAVTTRAASGDAPGFPSRIDPRPAPRLSSCPDRLPDPNPQFWFSSWFSPQSHSALASDPGSSLPSWINSWIHSLMSWWSTSLPSSWMNPSFVAPFGNDTVSLQRPFFTGTELSLLNFEFSYMGLSNIKTHSNGSIDWNDDQTLFNVLRLGYRLTIADPDIIVLFCPKYNTAPDSLAMQDLDHVKDLLLLLGHSPERIRIATPSTRNTGPSTADHAPIGVWTIRSGNYPSNIILLREGWVIHQNMNGDDLDHFFLRR